MKKTAYYLFLILFAILPFNAILTNYINFGLNIHIPINAWKEGIVVLLTFLSLIDITQSKRKIAFDILDYLISAFFILGMVSALFQTHDLGRIIFGFKYDFEFLWLFLVARHGFSFTPEQIKTLGKTILISGGIVILFALLQIFILPRDFLLLLGYSPNISSWVPSGPLPMYHAIDTDANIPRIASTLSGPNQFGAYLLIIIPLIVSLFFHKKKKLIISSIFLIFSLIVLFFTYSRSAYIALALIGIIGSFFFLRTTKYFKQCVGGIIGIVVIGIMGILLFKYDSIAHLVVRASSTQGHYDRTIDGVLHLFQTPLGYGIGNAGPASTRFNADMIGWIPENWYLQIGLEMGWMGVALFISILISTFVTLVRKKTTSTNKISTLLALSLLGISITSLFLHSWEESAVALTLWGILGLYLPKNIEKQGNKV